MEAMNEAPVVAHTKACRSVFAFSIPGMQGSLLTESVSNSLYKGSPDQLPYRFLQRLQALEALEAIFRKLDLFSSCYQNRGAEDLFNITAIRAFQVGA